MQKEEQSLPTTNYKNTLDMQHLDNIQNNLIVILVDTQRFAPIIMG